MIKIATIVGARPQFIKAAVVSRAIKKHNQNANRERKINEIIIHTGQHYDANMSAVFFDEMQIPAPDHHLDIHGLSHGAMTGQMLEEIEKLLVAENLDMVLVYGDTNTTLAGALAATKLHIPCAHVEAGLRSFNRMMPEEINRVVTDHVSNVLFCPTETALRNLKAEGIGNKRDHFRGESSIRQGNEPFKSQFRVDMVGDVMLDAALYYKRYEKRPNVEIPDNFILATIHRAENTDISDRLNTIFSAFKKIGQEIDIILPLHPRTRKIIQDDSGRLSESNVRITEPLGYLSMVYMLKRCNLVMTDSGGLQKEAFFFKKPCITLRDETEWVELVEHGYNDVSTIDEAAILSAFHKMRRRKLNFNKALYGDGQAGEKIVESIVRYLRERPGGQEAMRLGGYEAGQAQNIVD